MSMPPPPPPPSGGDPPSWQSSPPPPPPGFANPGGIPAQPYPAQPGYPAQSAYPGQPSYPQQGHQPGPPTRTTSSPLAWLAVAGCAVAAIGSFLVWVELSDGNQTFEFKGTDKGADGDRADGVITVTLSIIAAVLLVLGVTLRKRVLHILGAVAIGLTALIGFADVGDVNEAQDEQQFGSEIDISVGYGLWMVAAGATIGLIFAIIAAVQTKTRPVET